MHTARCQQCWSRATLAAFAQEYQHGPRNSAQQREATEDSTCNSLQVSAGDVSHNSLVLRCTSHLHLEGKEETKRWLMEELIHNTSSPYRQHWLFPLFPPSAVSETHTHTYTRTKITRDTHWGLLGRPLLLRTPIPSSSPLLQHLVLICHTCQDLTFSCPSQSHQYFAPAALPPFCHPAPAHKQDSGPPCKCHITLILSAAWFAGSL